MNRQTGQKNYGKGLSARIESWGQREYQNCLQRGPKVEMKKQMELKRQIARRDLQKQVGRLRENLSQMELSKNLTDVQDRQQAMEIQERLKSQLARNQQAMAAATLKLSQLQAGQNPIAPNMGGLAGAGPFAGLMSQMSGMSVPQGTPAEVQAVYSAQAAMNQSQSELMQLQSENQMILMQKSLFKGGRSSSRKGRGHSRSSDDSVGFEEVFSTVQVYIRARERAKTACHKSGELFKYNPEDDIKEDAIK